MQWDTFITANYCEKSYTMLYSMYCNVQKKSHVSVKTRTNWRAKGPKSRTCSSHIKVVFIDLPVLALPLKCGVLNTTMYNPALNYICSPGKVHKWFSAALVTAVTASRQQLGFLSLPFFYEMWRCLWKKEAHLRPFYNWFDRKYTTVYIKE